MRLDSVFGSQPPYRGSIPYDAMCYRCGRKATERHHILAGSLRNVSERNGLWVYMCRECHRDPVDGIHAKSRSMFSMKGAGKPYERTDDEHLRWHAQSQWMAMHGRKTGCDRETALEDWFGLAPSMPSYEYVRDDHHADWSYDWRKR